MSPNSVLIFDCKRNSRGPSVYFIISGIFFMSVFYQILPDLENAQYYQLPIQCAPAPNTKAIHIRFADRVHIDGNTL